METQQTTAGDIKKKQIRVPRSSIGAFPAGKVADLTLQFSAVADQITASPVAWFDGIGPNKTTSGQLRFAKAGVDLGQLCSPGDKFTVTALGGKTFRLDKIIGGNDAAGAPAAAGAMQPLPLPPMLPQHVAAARVAAPPVPAAAISRTARVSGRSDKRGRAEPTSGARKRPVMGGGSGGAAAAAAPPPPAAAAAAAPVVAAGAARSASGAPGAAKVTQEFPQVLLDRVAKLRFPGRNPPPPLEALRKHKAEIARRIQAEDESPASAVTVNVWEEHLLYSTKHYAEMCTKLGAPEFVHLQSPACFARAGVTNTVALLPSHAGDLSLEWEFADSYVQNVQGAINAMRRRARPREPDVDSAYALVALREYVHFIRLKIQLDKHNDGCDVRHGLEYTNGAGDNVPSPIGGACSRELDEVWHEHLRWDTLDYCRMVDALGGAGDRGMVHHCSTAALCDEYSMSADDAGRMLRACLRRTSEKRAAMAEWENPTVRSIWGDKMQCGICVSEIKAGERRARPNCCTHSFHWECMRQHVAAELGRRAHRQPECPLCRRSVAYYCDDEEEVTHTHGQPAPAAGAAAPAAGAAAAAGGAAGDDDDDDDEPGDRAIVAAAIAARNGEVAPRGTRWGLSIVYQVDGTAYGDDSYDLSPYSSGNRYYSRDGYRVSPTVDWEIGAKNATFCAIYI